jgi:hypothetical protein
METKKRGPGRPPGVQYPRKLPVYDTEEGMALLQALAKHRGISGAAVVRQLVREEARRVGFKIAPEPGPTSEGRSREEIPSGDAS